MRRDESTHRRTAEDRDVERQRIAALVAMRRDMLAALG